MVRRSRSVSRSSSRRGERCAERPRRPPGSAYVAGAGLLLFARRPAGSRRHRSLRIGSPSDVSPPAGLSFGGTGKVAGTARTRANWMNMSTKVSRPLVRAGPRAFPPSRNVPGASTRTDRTGVELRRDDASSRSPPALLAAAGRCTQKSPGCRIRQASRRFVQSIMGGSWIRRGPIARVVAAGAQRAQRWSRNGPRSISSLSCRESSARSGSRPYKSAKKSSISRDVSHW